MLNYNHLYYFHVAAMEGSVGAAATRLGVTQPTVSEQLRSLERNLGVSLFERRSTGLALSEAGRIAFEHTSVMFRVGDRLLHDLERSGGDHPHVLRVGVSGAVARSTSATFLMPLLALPGCTPSIRLVDCAELLRELRSSQLDLVVCENTPPEAERSELEVTTIERTTLVAVAGPRATPAADWSDVALLQFSTGCRYRAKIDAFLKARGLRPRLAGEADDAMFLLEAAAEGGHVAIVPAGVARDAIAAGRVKHLDTIETQHAAVYAIYRKTTAAELAKTAVAALVRARAI